MELFDIEEAIMNHQTKSISDHDQVTIEKPSNTSNHTQDEQAENHTPLILHDPLTHSVEHNNSDTMNTSLTDEPMEPVTNSNIEKQTSCSSPSIPTSITNNSMSASPSEQLNTSFEQIRQPEEQQLHRFAEDKEELGRYHSLKQAIDTMFKNVMNMRGTNVQSHRNETPFDIAVSQFPKQFLQKYESAMLEVFIAMQKRESEGFLEECSHYLKERGVRQKLNALDRTHKLSDCIVYMKRGTVLSQTESSYVVLSKELEDENLMKKKTCLSQLQDYLQIKKQFLQEIQNHNNHVRHMNEELRKKNDFLMECIQTSLLPDLKSKLSPILSSCENIDDYCNRAQSQQSSYN